VFDILPKKNLTNFAYTSIYYHTKSEHSKLNGGSAAHKAHVNTVYFGKL
jgi:hypothetical protein